MDGFIGQSERAFKTGKNLETDLSVDACERITSRTSSALIYFLNPLKFKLVRLSLKIFLMLASFRLDASFDFPFLLIHNRYRPERTLQVCNRPNMSTAVPWWQTNLSQYFQVISNLGLEHGPAGPEIARLWLVDGSDLWNCEILKW